MSGLSVRDETGTLVVSHDGAPLVSYVYRPTDVQLESPRPYFHPVRTLGGDLVSLFRPHDHVWHKGIAWSLPNVGPYNFWGGPTYVRDEGYVQLDNDGSMEHDGFRDVRVEGDAATVVEDLVWRAPPSDAGPGDAVVREEREIHVEVADGVWYLSFASHLTNVSGGALPFGSPTTNGRDNAGYGGLFWRGPRSFTDGTLLAPGVAGGEELRGERLPWMGFTGVHDGTATASSLVIVDVPGNPGGVPQWFARNENFACLCPAPFFSTEVDFPAGSTRTFRYAVAVADGAADPERAEQLAAVALAVVERISGAAAR
ncbi:oxidoreductase [Paraoerskovia sediminicola]|uniref:Oxidoreductase n=1 Tax=Paraoerskovia sediminicola TaxID=1138587 RepID=A0ABN6X9F1_9CELL|nr:PmoA family protein [Paraoerskovia sediminicola]BDZ41376.1 oxidoreductase [Paraoerskovia sediminicola]